MRIYQATRAMVCQGSHIFHQRLQATNHLRITFYQYAAEVPGKKESRLYNTTNKAKMGYSHDPEDSRSGRSLGKQNFIVNNKSNDIMQLVLSSKFPKLNSLKVFKYIESGRSKIDLECDSLMDKMKSKKKNLLR